MYRLDTPVSPAVSTKVRVRGLILDEKGRSLPAPGLSLTWSKLSIKQRPGSVAFAYRRRCFSSAAPNENHKTQKVEGNETSHAAAAVMQGARL